MAQAPIARIIYGEIMVPKIYSSVANTFLERAAFVFFFFLKECGTSKAPRRFSMSLFVEIEETFYGSQPINSIRII